MCKISKIYKTYVFTHNILVSFNERKKISLFIPYLRYFS